MNTVVSVIVPVYNAQDTLYQCVDSILSQAFTQFELILVNDGSHDNSLAICNAYAQADARVHVINQPNAGVGTARNAGLAVAQGKWITFVDADDYLGNHFFPADALQNNWDLIIGCYIDNQEGKLSCPFPALPQTQEFATNEALCGFLNTYLSSSILRGPCAKFFQRSVLQDIFFPADMKVGEDSYFVQRALLHVNRVLYMPSVQYVVRIGTQLQENKYKMTVDYAKQSLGYLLQSHSALKQAKGISSATFLGFLSYFKLVSKADWEKHRAKWYGDAAIRGFYKYVWKDLSWKLKVRIICSFILKK